MYADSGGGHDNGAMDRDYRISDSDRVTAVARLQAHCGAGRLSLDELLARSEAVRTAITRADLEALLGDLPDDTAPSRRGWRDRAWRAHACVYALSTGGAIGLWQVTRDRTPAPQDYGADYWWPLWLGLSWSIVLLVHYLYAAGLVTVPPWLRPDRDVRPAPPAPAPEPVESTVQHPATRPLEALTTREREILALVAEGHPNKEIARRLYISERTARTHVSNILRKLGLSSRTQAALFAADAGLTAPRRDDPPAVSR
jgi:DNA-binding CsgD family transcriptional regulator